MGGSSGSTSGGVKVLRHLILIKNGLLEFKRSLHPNAIFPLRHNNHVVEKPIIIHVLAFFILYLILFIIGAGVLSLLGLDFESSIGGAASSLGNGGRTPTALKTKGNVYIEGDLYVKGSTDTNSFGRLEARHKVADASPKKFDIVHPSEEGMRLAHACIEGAEVAIYHRGRVRNEKEILLPYYWKDLVHINSILVYYYSICICT